MGDIDAHMESDGGKRVLATTETSLDVIEALKRLDGGRVTQVAEELDLAPSTVHSHLVTLKERRYVVKEGDIYRLGLAFLNLGEYVRDHNHYFSLAKSKVKALAEETGGRAHFIVEEHGQGVYIYTASGKHAIETYSREGRRLSLHQAAAGKAIMAFLPEARVEEIVDRWGLPKRTENTITDRDELFETLAKVRKRNGLAFNDEEQIQGIRAAGAPVRAPAGTVIGALSVSGPSHWFTGDLNEQKLPDTVLGAANELELQIEYS